jgi:hypothetical protein
MRNMLKSGRLLVEVRSILLFRSSVISMDFPKPVSAESLQVIYEVMGPDTHILLFEELAWEIVNNLHPNQVEERLRSEIYENLTPSAYTAYTSVSSSLEADELVMELQELLAAQFEEMVDNGYDLDILADTLEELPYASLKQLLSNAYNVYLSISTVDQAVTGFSWDNLTEFSLGSPDPLDEDYIFSLN